MEWDIRGTSVVVLGAGFSVGATNGQMPPMGRYFDQLDARRFPALYDFISGTSGNPATANFQKVLLALDQIRTSPLIAVRGWADSWKQNAGRIQEELGGYTLWRLRSSLGLPRDCWPAELLAECGPQTAVISMNYDNIAERILSRRVGQRCHFPGMKGTNCPHCKMRLLLEKACSCEGHSYDIEESDWQGAVLKPHGSIAWKRCLNPACCSYQCLVADRHCRPFEPCDCKFCDEAAGHCLVMPSMLKNLEETPEIGIMWAATQAALSKAETLLLWGFSMPECDELLVQMIRVVLHREKRLKRVASIDPHYDEVLDKFARCVPEGLDIERVALPVETGIRPEWLPRTLEAARSQRPPGSIFRPPLPRPTARPPVRQTTTAQRLLDRTKLSAARLVDPVPRQDQPPT